MIMNYNRWFKDFYQYKIGNNRNRLVFNDIKWENVNERMRILNNMNSPLLSQQPFGVMGNHKGFDHLLDLMGRSNYTFDDINESLIKTYNHSLKNAMGRMLVNTQAVMFRTTNMDHENTVGEEFTHYYIVEAPFMQLHFGGRDEYIRQHISTMQTRGAPQWMTIQDFLTRFNFNLRDKENQFGVRDEQGSVMVDRDGNTIFDSDIPVDNGPITVLPFTIIATVNGYICNDFQIGITDNGLRFRIGWPYSNDVDFVIYKLDHSEIFEYTVDIDTVLRGFIPFNEFGNLHESLLTTDRKCFVNIYDPNFMISSPSVPNFGEFEICDGCKTGKKCLTNGRCGFRISNLQSFTRETYERLGSEELKVVIYVLKYFHEVPNLYPAANWVQLMENRQVFDENGLRVSDHHGTRVGAKNILSIKDIDMTVPPIVLDKNTNVMFDNITLALSLRERMLPPVGPSPTRDAFQAIGNIIEEDSANTNQNCQMEIGTIDPDDDGYNTDLSVISAGLSIFGFIQIQEIIKGVDGKAGLYDTMKQFFIDYTNGALLTSLIPPQYIHRYEELLRNLKALKDIEIDRTLIQDEDGNVIEEEQQKIIDANQALVNNAVRYFVDEFFHNNFELFVMTITEPFKSGNLSNFIEMINLAPNYFRSDRNNSVRFNRPVSEQCFITLKFNHIDRCWLFDLPRIEHFKGIGNAFYVQEDLKGDEIYKFFVLYTDTENPAHPEVPAMTADQAFDFDKFCDQLDRHIGYIRYWHAENKLLKMSKILYDRYNDETCVSVLSKAMQRKIAGEDLLDIYPSDMNYEASAITSSNTHGYSEDSETAPFAINFLFYTLAMMNGQEGNIDKLQAYFYHQLTREKHNQRYFDMKIPFDDEVSLPINFSRITNLESGPEGFGIITGEHDPISAYHGMPFIVDRTTNTIIQDGYRLMFNRVLKKDLRIRQDKTQHSLLIQNNVDPERFISPTVEQPSISLVNDLYFARLLTFYLTSVYAGISALQTNFTTSYNMTLQVKSIRDNVNREIQKIRDLIDNKPGNVTSDRADEIMDMFSETAENPVLTKLDEIDRLIQKIFTYRVDDWRYERINDFFGRIIGRLRWHFRNFGFVDLDRARITNFYNHLRRINLESMNWYQYTRWLNNFDDDCWKILDTLFADNRYNDPIWDDEGNRITPDIFTSSWTRFSEYREEALEALYDLNQVVKYFTHYSAYTITSLERLGIFIKDLQYALFQSQHVLPIVRYIEYVLSEKIHSFYVLDNIEIDFQGAQWNNEPYLLIIDCPPSKHFVEPVTGTTSNSKTLIFQPTVDWDRHGMFWVSNLSKICEYAFFDDTPIETMARLVDRTMQHLHSLPVTITFKQIGLSMDLMNDFKQIVGIRNLIADFSNHHAGAGSSGGMTYNFFNTHDDYEVMSQSDGHDMFGEAMLALSHDQMRAGFGMQGVVFSKQHVSTAYELLYGNNFAQLPFTTQFINNKRGEMEGPFDRVEVHHQFINELVNTEYAKRDKDQMFFRPTQVFHPPIGHKVIGQRTHDEINSVDLDHDDLNHFTHDQIRARHADEGCMESVGSRYFVGQTLMVYSGRMVDEEWVPDTQSLFMIRVTALDHAINKGFIEAVIDGPGRWFEPKEYINESTGEVIETKQQIISRYLRESIPCKIIDDNIRNFLCEFTDSSLSTMSNVFLTDGVDPRDTNFPDYWSMPGDPIFVQNNAAFVYTRLVWFFNEVVPNRFIDDQHKQRKFLYIGNFDTQKIEHPDPNHSERIQISMINHNFDPFNIQEKYGVLREEPNDHNVWDEQTRVFTKEKEASDQKIEELSEEILDIKEKLKDAVGLEKQDLEIDLERLTILRQKYIDFSARMLSYLTHIEPPTTWYNVRAYDDALVYIDNGRAVSSHTFVPNIRDLPYTDKLDVFIYDWENKVWIDPNTYSCSPQFEHWVRLNNFDNYTTHQILNKLYIDPKEGFPESKSLLVYFSWDQSDVFDSIPSNEYICDVRFSPILSLPREEIFDPYSQLRIRKHMGAREEYVFIEGTTTPTDFSMNVGYYIRRPIRSGENTFTSAIRMCDIELAVSNGPINPRTPEQLFYEEPQWIFVEHTRPTPTSIYYGTTDHNTRGTFTSDDIFNTHKRVGLINHLTPRFTIGLIGGYGMDQELEGDFYFLAAPMSNQIISIRERDLETEQIQNFQRFNNFPLQNPNDGSVEMYQIFISPTKFQNLGCTQRYYVYPRGLDTSHMFDLWVRMPFKHIDTSDTRFHYPSYNTIINSPIDSFEPDETVRLIALHAEGYDGVLYDGNISTVMFEALTVGDPNMSQHLEVKKSSLRNFDTGTFYCTVFQDNGYHSVGGLITIEVTTTEEEILDEMIEITEDGQERKHNNWVRIPHELSMYRELPEEFILTPRGDLGILDDPTRPVKIAFIPGHDETSFSMMMGDNSNTWNPFEYYINEETNIRFPISKIQQNDHKQRLLIDTGFNPGTKLVKSTYLHVCRFSLQEIPRHGVINLTGFLPTPLSRTRYEFWVNGRFLNEDNVVILSPTSVLLKNLKSLRNFEVIELVEDMESSLIMRESNIYIGLDGKTYGSFEHAVLANAKISQQNLQYQFNASQHRNLNMSHRGLIENPNNRNIEKNILDCITIPSGAELDYRNYHNTPSINGIPLGHPKISTLGIQDTPNEKILDQYDSIWKLEAFTDPNFPMTHRMGQHDARNQSSRLIVYGSAHRGEIGFTIPEGMIALTTRGFTDRFFSLYVNETSTGMIWEPTTLKIIPFIRSGVYVLISDQFRGHWLHSTHPLTDPVRIM